MQTDEPGSSELSAPEPLMPAAPPAQFLPGLVASAPGSDADGTIVVVDASGHRTFIAAPGARLLVGADPAATIRVIDPRVGMRHASIERKGPGWLVTSLDQANPIWLLDATGRPHPVMEELGLKSGTLLAGTTQLLLYPPAT